MTNKEKEGRGRGSLALGLTAVDVSARVLDFIEELFLSVEGELRHLVDEARVGAGGVGGDGDGG